MPDSKLKYQQLLQYAKQLPPLPADMHTEEHKVRGCVSQVRKLPAAAPSSGQGLPHPVAPDLMVAVPLGSCGAGVDGPHAEGGWHDLLGRRLGLRPHQGTRLPWPADVWNLWLPAHHTLARLTHQACPGFGQPLKPAAVQGLAALLVQGLSGASPEQIARLDPTWVSDLSPQLSLTPSRTNGFLNMFRTMQSKSLAMLVAQVRQPCPELPVFITCGPC